MASKKAPFFLIVLAIVLFWSLFPMHCMAQLSSIEMNSLTNNSKLNNAVEIMQDFKDGNKTTDVIVLIQPVDLTGPSKSSLSKDNSSISAQNGKAASKTYDLSDIKIKTDLNNIVTQTINNTIKSLNPDPNEINIDDRFSYIFGFSATVSAKGLQTLVQRSDIISIEKNIILYPHLAQGIPLMNATSARSSYDGSGVSIAICDTGIDTEHPRLGNGGSPIFNSKVIGGYDTGDNDADPRPSNPGGGAHGTACAGISAGDLGTTGDYIGGVAPGAKLYAIKISYGDAGSATTADMIQGWEWCITHQNDDPSNPIMIISTSFGGGQYTSTCNTASSSMTTAAANAVSAGMTLFVSSGNDGFCNAMGWPACITHVISVGAVYDASFGTYHPCLHADSCAPKTAGGCASGWYGTDVTAADMVTSYSNSASFLSLFAPANQAYTADITGSGGYTSGDYTTSFGGTSAACPYAAGAAAVLQHAAKSKTGSYLTPAQVESYLLDNGDNITDGKIAITKPRVNLGNAVDALPGSGPTPTSISDGDFENGPPPASDWTELNSGYNRILDPTSGWGISAHGGTYAWWGGGYYYGAIESNSITQTVSIPSTGGNTLQFYANFYRVDADDPTPDDIFRVKINGTTVYSKNLTSGNETYPSWEKIQVDIGSYAGQSVTLMFGVTSIGSATGNVLIDDVSIPGGGGAAIPAVNSLLLN